MRLRGSVRDRNRIGFASGGTPPVDIAALEPPISSALSSKLVEAWGFDRLVDGYSGDTIVAKNNDTSINANYGFDANGRFNGALPSNSDLVNFIGQKGSGVSLAAVSGSATLALTRSGVSARLAATQNSDGTLTRSTNKGGIGVDLAATGMLQTAALPVSLSTEGYELHILWSPNNRKRSSNDTTDPLPSDNVRENICCYGLNSNNQMIAYMGGGTAVDFCRMQAGGQQNGTNGKQSQGTYRFQGKSQYVTSYVMSQTAFMEIEHGKVTKSIALNAATTTAIQGASMDNGVIGIGGNFAGTGSSALAITNKGNIVVSAVILTKSLTDFERFILQCKLSLIGQQHLARSKEFVESEFDELVDMRDTDPLTGRVVGKNGLLTVDFNQSAFEYGYAVPNFGVTGIRSPGNETTRSFQATNNWFYDCLTGSIMRFGFLESGAQNNSLQFDFGMANGDPQTDTRGDCSLLLGYHHTIPAMGTKPAASIDTLPRMGTRRKEDLTLFGQSIYDALNQTIGKYNWFIANILRVVGETISGYVWTGATWENTDPGAPYKLDAPVPQHTAGNLSYSYKQAQLQLHIGTFEKPADYDPLSPDATKFLTAKNQSFVSGGSINPIGHMDGSIAKLDYSGVRHANSNHRVQSVPYQYQMIGTRLIWGFKKDKKFTLDEAEVIRANLYKLIA